MAAEAQSDQAACLVIREADVAARVVVRQDVVPVLLVDELVGAVSAITVLIEGEREAKKEGAASACDGVRRAPVVDDFDVAMPAHINVLVRRESGRGGYGTKTPSLKC